MRIPEPLKPLVFPFLLAVFFAAAYAARVNREMVDFAVYQRAAARAANAENLYRPSDGHYQYKYLPVFAFPMWPFAKLPDPVARIAWYGLSCALLVMMMRWSVRALPERNMSETALFWLAALFLLKFYAREITLGQTNVLLGTMLVGALMAAQVDARRTAGVLVALGVFVKVYALILLPWLWLAAGIPGLAAAGLVLAIGLLLPAAVYGWQGNIDQLAAWYRTVTDTTAPNLLNPENVSAAAAWTKWTGDGPQVAWLAAATILGALGLVVAAVSRRRQVGDPLYLEFGLLMLLVPIISPQGWDYVLLLAAPAIIVIVDRWKLVSVSWRVATAVAILFMSFTVYDLIGRPAYRFMMDISVMTLAVLTLAVCLVNLRWKALA